MTTVTRTYKNEQNGGKERVTKTDGKFYVNSDWGKGFSRFGQHITESDMRCILRATKAPSEVVFAILGE